jgi:hypothetical protein
MHANVFEKFIAQMLAKFRIKRANCGYSRNLPANPSLWNPGEGCGANICRVSAVHLKTESEFMRLRFQVIILSVLRLELSVWIS